MLDEFELKWNEVAPRLREGFNRQQVREILVKKQQYEKPQNLARRISTCINKHLRQVVIDEGWVIKNAQSIREKYPELCALRQALGKPSGKWSKWDLEQWAEAFTPQGLRSTEEGMERLAIKERARRGTDMYCATCRQSASRLISQGHTFNFQTEQCGACSVEGMQMGSDRFGMDIFGSAYPSPPSHGAETTSTFFSALNRQNNAASAYNHTSFLSNPSGSFFGSDMPSLNPTMENNNSNTLFGSKSASLPSVSASFAFDSQTNAPQSPVAPDSDAAFFRSEFCRNNPKLYAADPETKMLVDLHMYLLESRIKKQEEVISQQKLEIEGLKRNEGAMVENGSGVDAIPSFHSNNGAVNGNLSTQPNGL